MGGKEEDREDHHIGSLAIDKQAQKWNLQMALFLAIKEVSFREVMSIARMHDASTRYQEPTCLLCVLDLKILGQSPSILSLPTSTIPFSQPPTPTLRSVPRPDRAIANTPSLHSGNPEKRNLVAAGRQAGR